MPAIPAPRITTFLPLPRLAGSPVNCFASDSGIKPSARMVENAAEYPPICATFVMKLLRVTGIAALTFSPIDDISFAYLAWTWYLEQDPHRLKVVPLRNHNKSPHISETGRAAKARCIDSSRAQSSGVSGRGF